ncbi:MAG: glycosyltransferase family 9 protein [Vampirovibrionia bacterium]
MNNKYKDIKKVLFIRTGAIGDVVHTTATFQVLKKQYPDMQIDYLTSPMMVNLLSNDPDLTEIHSLDKKTYKNLPALYKYAKKLSSYNYDIVINLQPSIKTIVFSKLLKPKHILTYKKHRPFKNKTYIHVVDNYLQTIDPLIDNKLKADNLKIYISDENKEWSNSYFTKNSIDKALAIIPGVSKARLNKLWPKEYWIDLVQKIIEQFDYKIIIIGGNDELPISEELLKLDNNRVYNLCNALNIEETAAILNDCTIAIGSDTGPTHMASALNTRTIGLYGPTSPDRVGIYSSNHNMIHSKHECLFCEKKKCFKKDKINPYAPCMVDLSVDEVVKLIAQ